MLTPLTRSIVAWFQSRSPVHQTATELYGAIVTQARAPAFYARHGVPDTPDGRYEVIVLHLFLVLERLQSTGELDRDLSQNLIEVFIEDMDDSMREMGVGDLSVPRKVKKAAAGLYDRAGVYRLALAADTGEALAAALEASIPAQDGEPLKASDLAQYMRACAAHLAQQPVASVSAGRITFTAVA